MTANIQKTCQDCMLLIYHQLRCLLLQVNIELMWLIHPMFNSHCLVFLLISTSYPHNSTVWFINPHPFTRFKLLKTFEKRKLNISLLSGLNQIQEFITYLLPAPLNKYIHFVYCIISVKISPNHNCLGNIKYLFKSDPVWIFFTLCFNAIF